MNSQSTTLAEALTTHLTLEGLVLAVDVLVVAEVVLSSERLATDVARVGSLVGVGPLVDQQIVALCELTITKPADVALLGSAESTGRA